MDSRGIGGPDDETITEFAASSAFLRSLIAHIQDGLSVSDLQGRRVLINPALCEMTGYTAAELMVESPPYPCWPAEEADKIRKVLAGAREGDASPTEAVLQRKDGTRLPVLLRPALVTDRSGHAVAMFNTITDLTETKRAAAALEASERRWRSIAENPFDFISIIGRDYKFRFMNRTVRGVHMGDLIGKATPFDFTAAEHHAQMLELFETAFQTGSASSYEAYWPTANLWYSTVVGAIESEGGIQELSLLSRDITDTKEAERAQRRSERRLALALEGVNDGLVDRNLLTGEHSYSARMYQLLGYPQGDPALSTGAEGLRERIHPEDREAAELALQASLKNGAPFVSEYRLRTRDGSYRWFQARGQTVIDNSGESSFIAFLTDISERREAEEQRRALALELQQAQRLETIGTLAGGIAHDFNNLLTPIMGALEFTKLALPPTHVGYAAIGEGLNAALRAKQLIQQILTFARHGDARVEPVDLVELAKEELRLRSGVLSVNVPIDTSFDAVGPTVMGDRTQLQQVIANLIANALHAMQGRSGHVQLSIERVDLTEDPTEDGWQIERGPYARIAVRDHGIGMSEEVQRRVYEPFFTTKPPGQGTGLGLAVVHGIVTRHDGQIRIRSRPGEGTLCEVYLPASAHAVQARVESNAPISMVAPALSGRILCVDDEPGVLGVVQRALEMVRYDVTTTTSASEAWDLIQQGTTHFDLMITDFRMPDFSGLELARRATALRPSLPVILITGFADGLPRSSTPPGVTAVLLKPFRLDELIDAVQSCLSDRAPSAELRAG